MKVLVSVNVLELYILKTNSTKTAMEIRKIPTELANYALEKLNMYTSFIRNLIFKIWKE